VPYPAESGILYDILTLYECDDTHPSSAFWTCKRINFPGSSPEQDPIFLNENQRLSPVSLSPIGVEDRLRTGIIEERMGHVNNQKRQRFRSLEAPEKMKVVYLGIDMQEGLEGKREEVFTVAGAFYRPFDKTSPLVIPYTTQLAFFRGN